MTDQTEDKDRALVEALLGVLGDRYAFVSRLGAGAFGEVYCLHDSMLERDVAVKRVRLDAFADNEQRNELRERTIREAKVAAKLKHPNIVTIYDVVDRPDMSFIIMEYIEGKTLARLLKEKGRLSLEETAHLMSQTASALDFAHARGIVHRDIKPANIMVESSGNVKVTDFGIAKSDAFSELTAAGSVLGTPNYMAPEQARGEASINKSADLFSLGCVLYECLVGQKAFVGKTVMATLMSIMNEGPRPASYEALGLRGPIAEIMDRALAKDPNARYATAGELIASLRSLPPPSEPAQEQATVVTSTPEIARESRPSPQVVTRREPGSKSSFDASLQGELTGTTVAELVRKVYSARHTGILHLQRDGIAKRVYFKKGNVVFANSDVNEDRLGEFLIRNGLIERETFDRVSAAMRETGKRLGTSLIELASMSQEKLQEAVRSQVQEIIYSLFEWENGTYGLELLEKPVEEDIIVDLSTAELILIGIRRMKSIDRIRSALGSLDRVLRQTENPLLLYQKMTLTPSEGYVLSRVDGATSVADIASISPLGEDETLRCVYALVAAGVAELASRGSTPTSRIRVETVTDAPPAAPSYKKTPEPAASAGSPRAEAKSQDSESPERDKQLLEDIAAKHASLETADYYELLEVSPGASDEDIKKGYYAMARKYHPDRHHSPHLRELQGLLEELFAKITFAYQELSDPGSRRRYDGARQQKARETSESASSGAAPSPPAYTVPPEVMAERRYQQGLKHFEQMEYFDCIQCLRDSVRMMPAEARYHKLLARALSKNPHWRKEAEFHFNEALKANEFDLECLMGLAENYDAANLKTRAAKVYERILAYDPDNEVARERLQAKPKDKK